MATPGSLRVELERSSGTDLSEFLNNETLSRELFMSNSASLNIVIALARQAQQGLTTQGEVPRKLRQRLCELSGIPSEQHYLILDFRPIVAREGDIQVVSFKPVYKDKLPQDARPPFISWGQLMSGFFSTMFARPALTKPGEFIYTYARQSNETFESLFESHIGPLLWVDEGHLPEKINTTPFLFTAKPQCKIATRAIFTF
jgi:hypothetical protein